MKVIFHGVKASLEDHSAIEIQTGDHRILIEPSQQIPGITDVIVCDSDPDEWAQLAYYDNLPIYTTQAIAKSIPDVIKTINAKNKFTIGDLHFEVFDTSPTPERKSIGLTLPDYKLTIIPEAPPKLYITIKNRIKDHHVICGMGNFSGGDHKISFMDFITYAPKPKSLWITNLRENLIKHRTEVNKLIEEKIGKGHIVRKGEVLEFRQVVKSLETLEKIHDISKYDPSKQRDDQLRDDWRWVVSWYGQATNPDIDFKYTKEEVLAIGEKIAKELAKRVREGKTEFQVSERKGETYRKFWKELRERLTPEERQILTGMREKSIKRGYYSTAKPYYRFELPLIHDDLKKVGWDQKKLVIDTKADGLRVTAGHTGNETWVYVDPELLKEKSPDVSKRLPRILEDLKHMPEGTILDAELISVKGNECLHRTVTNAILNSKMPAEEFGDLAHLFVFDVIFWKGEDVRSYPLHERLELLSQLKDQEHIMVDRPIIDLDRNAFGYIMNGSDKKAIDRAIDKILNIQKPKFLAEGVMIKLIDHSYETKTNHGWAKAKKYYEVDLVVLDKHLVKGAKKTWNYELGINIEKDYYDHLPEKYRAELKGKYYMRYGKSDNSGVDVKIGEVLRVASEEVLKEENEDYPDYPIYRGYINRVLEPIPEKSRSDTLDVLERLSQLQPKRMSIEEIRRIKERVKAKKLTKEEYEQIKEQYKGRPLPKEYYVDYREGRAWSQWHIRGLLPEDVEKYKKGEISFEQLVKGHSVHCDLRMDLGEKKLIQWVITDNDLPSYLRMMKGETDPSTGNVQKSKAIVKPSALEQEPKEKALNEGKLIDDEGAKILKEYDIKEGSYFIEPGQVGTYKDTYAYMELIWKGKVKAGVQREDMHEYFFYPDDDIPEKNKEIFNGKFIVRCFKQATPTWWIFKSAKDPYPQNPYCHVDQGEYFPKRETDVKHFGHESYPEWKQRKEDCE